MDRERTDGEQNCSTVGDKEFCMSRRVVGNAASVMAVQAGSYLLPLVNIPYLLRVIGPEHYGLIAFSQAVMAYFVTLNEYGFNLSATRELAVHRHDPTLRSELYCSVMAIKIILCLLSFGILCLLVLLVPSFHRNQAVFFASFGIVVGTMLFPQWFFQGIEKMYWISAVNLAANALFTAGIYLLVRHPEDYLIAAIVQSGGKVAAGIIGLIVLFSTERVGIIIPTYAQIRHRFVDGWHLFISTAAYVFYTSSNAVVLGLVCGMTQVGYFSAANKLYTAGQMLIAPMCQAIYPHVCSLAHRSRELAVSYLRKSMIVIGGISFVGGVAVILLATPIVRVAMGARYVAAVPVLELMAMTPFVYVINNIYGTQGLLNFGMKKQFSGIIVLSAFFNNIILIPLCFWFKAPGAAVSGLITQSVMTIAMAVALHSKDVDLRPRLSDVKGLMTSVSALARRNYEKVLG
jgi:polysaccharide transporter, PST family